jgi:hypothetical protein
MQRKQRFYSPKAKYPKKINLKFKIYSKKYVLFSSHTKLEFKFKLDHNKELASILTKR